MNYGGKNNFLTGIKKSHSVKNVSYIILVFIWWCGYGHIVGVVN